MEISEEICRFLPAFVSQSASSFYPHFTWRILSRPIIRLVWVVVYLCTLLKMAAYMSSSLSSEADDSDGKSSAFCYMHTIDTHGRVLLFSEKSFIKFKECAAHWKSWKIVQKVPLACHWHCRTSRRPIMHPRTTWAYDKTNTWIGSGVYCKVGVTVPSLYS